MLEQTIFTLIFLVYTTYNLENDYSLLCCCFLHFVPVCYIYFSGDTVEPPQATGNQSTSLSKGETRHVTLTARGARHSYMWICFTTDPAENMWNIQLNNSCVKCKERSCYSPSLPNRPHWTVSRDQTGCVGDSIIEISVLVKDFSKRDTGRLMLTWSSDDPDQGPQEHKVLTVTSLHYRESISQYVYAGIGVGGGCVVVVASVVVVVAGRYWYKRKKRAANRARRMAERRCELILCLVPRLSLLHVK